MAAITGTSCYTSCPESGYFLGTSSMTIELCLQACTSQLFGGHDIRIYNNGASCSDLGDCYSHPQYAEGTYEAKTFLAGSNKFQLAEIEVYQKE